MDLIFFQLINNITYIYIWWYVDHFKNKLEQNVKMCYNYRSFHDLVHIEEDLFALLTTHMWSDGQGVLWIFVRCRSEFKSVLHQIFKRVASGAFTFFPKNGLPFFIRFVYIFIICWSYCRFVYIFIICRSYC